MRKQGQIEVWHTDKGYGTAKLFLLERRVSIRHIKSLALPS